MRFTIQYTGKENGGPVSMTLAVVVDATVLDKIDPTEGASSGAEKNADGDALGGTRAQWREALKRFDAATGDAKARFGRELAWDLFKRKTGLRRWPGDVPPVITQTDEVPDGADSGPNHTP